MSEPEINETILICELKEQTSRLLRENHVLRYQLHAESKKSERLLQQLCEIHALLYPPRVTLSDGKVMQFQSPMHVEQIQALSDAIRAIPDKLAAREEAGS